MRRLGRTKILSFVEFEKVIKEQTDRQKHDHITNAPN